MTADGNGTLILFPVSRLVPQPLEIVTKVRLPHLSWFAATLRVGEGAETGHSRSTIWGL